MLTLPVTLLYGMLLLTVPSRPETESSLPNCETGTRHISLEADTRGPVPEICIRPELALNLFFDTKLARVEVEGRDRFRRIDEGTTSVMLIASEAMLDGERVRVTVAFQSEVVPTSATFILVLHPSQAERQVEFSRHERTVVSYRQGEQQARAEMQRCQEEKARLRSEYGGRRGLTEFILLGWFGTHGVTARDLRSVQRPGLLLDVRSLTSYQAVGLEGHGRVAIEVGLLNTGTTAWTPVGAVLVGANSKHLSGWTIWPLEPIPPDTPVRLVIETDASSSEIQGSFTLKVWDEQGRAGLILDGIMFP